MQQQAQREYMAEAPRVEDTDVIIVGAGHNGLVAAVLLAKKGLRVTVLEEKDVIGGCVRTEFPFPKHAPNLGSSTGAYLLGLMPPELIQKLGIEIPTVRRDPHYFLPTLGSKYLLFGSNAVEMKRQFLEFFSEADWQANERLNAEIAAIRDDIAPTWLMEPLSIEETAERFVRPALRQAFIDLCRKPVSDYLLRFGFRSNLLMAMYATTDGFSGLTAGWDTPGTGMNFLVHNMCRLPGADGTWMIVRGGMGQVTTRLAEAARRAGARIETGRGVQELIISGGRVRGVVTRDGRQVHAPLVVVNADPFRMRDIVGRANFPPDYNLRLDNYKRDGTTMKINLCLKGLPKFTCLPEDRGQYGPTIHILPQGEDVIESVRQAWREAQEGRLPRFPTIEVYMHSTKDPSIQDAERHHNAALFVQWVPYTIKGSSWEKEEQAYVQHLFSIVDQFAPGFSSLVVDYLALPPPKLEKHFGITRGHIHHVDNSFGFSDRLPYHTPIKGLYSASAGTHPAGSVIGCAGHNSAMRVIKDLEAGAVTLQVPPAPKM